MSKMNSKVSSFSDTGLVADDNVIISASYHTNQFLAQNTCKPPAYYLCSMALLAPLYRIKVLQRSYSNDNYKQEVSDRFGQRYKTKPNAFSLTKLDANLTDNLTGNVHPDKNKDDISPMIWCHAVSLGETNTVAPLLKRLMDSGCHIWLTNTTHTGYTRSQTLFAEEIKLGKLQHGFVPIDKPKVINRFLDYVKPKVALFVETELWATTLYQLANRNIPSILVNARLSEKSFIQYQKIGKVSRSMMENIGFILAQDADSAKRFRMLGADSAKIRVVGTLKWTVNITENDGSSNAKLISELDSELSSEPSNEIVTDTVVSIEALTEQKTENEKVTNQKINHKKSSSGRKNSKKINKLRSEQLKATRKVAKDSTEEEATSSYAERAAQRKRRKAEKQRENLPQQLLPKKTLAKLAKEEQTDVESDSRYTSKNNADKTIHPHHKAVKRKRKSQKPINESQSVRPIKEAKLINVEPLTRSNLKPEISHSLLLHSKNHKKRLVWIAASTHQSEEEIALIAHKKIIKQSKQSLSHSLLIIVPRHPERFEQVARIIADSGLNYCRRSKNERPDETTQVYLADSMSELPVWYDIADIAFVGGSMVNCGGHNPIEAVAQATPVIMGQYTQSCQIIIDTLVSDGVLRQIVSKHKKGHNHTKGKPLKKEIIIELSEQLFMDVKSLLENDKDRQAIAHKGKKIVQAHQSVLDRQFETIMEVARPQVSIESKKV